MQNRKHLRLLSEKQLEKIIPMKFKYGFGQIDEDEEDKPRNYYRIAQTLNRDRVRFDREIVIKRKTKDVNLQNTI